MIVNGLKTSATAGDHHRGNLRAPLQIILFGDYECVFSRETDADVRELQAAYGTDLCFAYRHFPRTRLHQNAGLAAVAAEAANLQGHFWQMHDAFMSVTGSLSTERIFVIARELQLDLRKFADDLRSEELLRVVMHDLRDGLRNNVKLTPTLFINAVRVEGFLALGQLRRITDRELDDRKFSFLGGQ
jgi:protein-disulfide isomerase